MTAISGLGICIGISAGGGLALIWLLHLMSSGREKRRTAWQSLAQDLNLTFEGDNFLTERVSGVYRGRSLCLEHVPQANAMVATRWRAFIDNPAGLFLHLFPTKEKEAPEMVAAVHHVPLNRPEFDRRVTIHARPRALAKELLQDAELRQQLLDCLPFDLKADGRQCRLLLHRDTHDCDTLHRHLNLLCDLADALEQQAWMTDLKPPVLTHNSNHHTPQLKV